jgi:hypothetical protein
MRNTNLLRLSALLWVTILILLTLTGGAHAHWHDKDPSSVPEIDVGMAASGVTLVIASILVLVDRLSPTSRRKRRSDSCNP